MPASHGTRKKYEVEKCRCDLCCARRRQYNKERNEQKKNNRIYLPPEPIWEVMTQEQRNNAPTFMSAYSKKGIPLYNADRWCIKLGLHPWSVYGDVWFEESWRRMGVEVSSQS